MRKFSVSAELELMEEETISLANEVPGAGNHVFVSKTRAYSLSTDLDRVVIWNPDAMEITGSIDIPKLDRDRRRQQ